MKDKPQQADDEFDDGLADQQVSPFHAPFAGQPGAQRHAAHEDRQHQGVCLSRAPQKQLHVLIVAYILAVTVALPIIPSPL